MGGECILWVIRGWFVDISAVLVSFMNPRRRRLYKYFVPGFICGKYCNTIFVWPTLSVNTATHCCSPSTPRRTNRLNVEAFDILFGLLPRVKKKYNTSSFSFLGPITAAKPTVLQHHMFLYLVHVFTLTFVMKKSCWQFNAFHCNLAEISATTICIPFINYCGSRSNANWWFEDWHFRQSKYLLVWLGKTKIFLTEYQVNSFHWHFNYVFGNSCHLLLNYWRSDWAWKTFYCLLQIMKKKMLFF